jgi:hypothetical protein
MNENPLDTQPDPPGIDPWDRIHDADRDIHLPATPQSHEPPSFTLGEKIFWGLLLCGIVASISYLAILILNEMLELP